MGAKRKNHFNKNAVKEKYNPPFPDNVLKEPIENLGLKSETSTLLKSGKIYTLGDVLSRTEKDFFKIPHFNKKTLLDLTNCVKKRNLFFRPLPSDTLKQEATNQKEPKKEIFNKKDKHLPSEQQHVFTTLIQRPPKPVHTPVKEELDIYIKISKNQLWGFKDKKTNAIVVDTIYDDVFSFKEDLCCVEKDEKYGFINRKGEIVIPLEYDCATSFSEGYACVFKGDFCGYINTKNEVVVDFQYEAGTPVENGECRVKKFGKWGELHIAVPNSVRWII